MRAGVVARWGDWSWGWCWERRDARPTVVVGTAAGVAATDVAFVVILAVTGPGGAACASEEVPLLVPLELSLALVELEWSSALCEFDFRVADQNFGHGIAPHYGHVRLGVTS